MSDEPRWNSRPGSGRRGDDPLEQRLDRWVSAGRQLVDGVSGARPGSRPSGRGATPRAGSRPRLDNLGRWMGDKLDWLLDDNDDDWREPWEQTDRGGSDPRAPQSSAAQPSWPSPRSREEPSRQERTSQDWSRDARSPFDGSRDADPFNTDSFNTEPSRTGRANRGQASAGQVSVGRRPLDAISRRQRAGGSAGSNPRIASAGLRPSEPVDSRSGQARPADPRPARSEPDTQEDWPDQTDFSLPRWQRPSPGTMTTAPTAPIEPEAGGRPLPRSSRRRP